MERSLALQRLLALMRQIDTDETFAWAEAYEGNAADQTLKISVTVNAATYWRTFNTRRGEGGSSR